MKQPHDHPAEESQRLLKIGIFLSFAIFVLEFWGGLWTRSLALTSDALHIFIDIWSLILSYLAVRMARRPVDDRKTFGLHRMEVLAATVNGLTVFLIAGGILVAAWHRFRTPTPVHAGPLLLISSIGLALNLLVAAILYRRSKQDLNIRGAFLHIVGDAANTVAVMIAAGVMMATNSPLVDPIVSVVIAGMVLWGSGRLLRECLNTLLEGVPRHIDVTHVERELLSVPGVVSLHDLHVWSICSHLNALSGHVLVNQEQMARQHLVLEELNVRLRDRFGIAHTTIQVESSGWPNIEAALDQAQHG